jgi:hypothetical protein
MVGCRDGDLAAGPHAAERGAGVQAGQGQGHRSQEQQTHHPEEVGGRVERGAQGDERQDGGDQQGGPGDDSRRQREDYRGSVGGDLLLAQLLAQVPPRLADPASGAALEPRADLSHPAHDQWCQGQDGNDLKKGGHTRHGAHRAITSTISRPSAP